jgi:Spy/CpxP family protein refolding chaperone
MRKFVIALAAAGTALAFATPAAAQYYPQPQPQPYGYGYNGYNNGYNGYGHNNYGQVRALQARIDALQNQIRRLDRRDAIGDGSADRLREESRNIERRLHSAERYGLNGYEANDIQMRIARLEQRVQYAFAGRYGGYGNNYGHDRDRDHDGRWDRDDD